MSDNGLITHANVREYFKDAVHSALSHQQLRFHEETVFYVINMLTMFQRAEHLYEQTSDGLMIKPLAKFYGEALEANSVEERDRALQRLGDVALFISGVFADSLSRSLVDVDYYIAMGGNAYSFLADSGQLSRNRSVLRDVFAEMADRFDKWVDVLSEVSDNNNLSNNKDVLRLYEIWLSTGSERVAGKLQKLGVHPISVGRNKH